MTFSVVEVVPDPDSVDEWSFRGWCESDLPTREKAEDYIESLRSLYGGQYVIVEDSDELA